VEPQFTFLEGNNLAGLGITTATETKATSGNLLSPLDEIFGGRNEYLPKMRSIANEILVDLDALARSNIDENELSVLSQDKNHPAWQFVRQLGIDPSTANAELINQTMDAFNKEINSQITELTKRRNELKQKNPYEVAINELLPMMIAIGALAPETTGKIMPVLMAMAPKIKDRAIEQLESRISALTDESTRKNLQAANTLSLIEQRATSAGRLALAYVQEERRSRAQRASQKIRIFGTLLDQWYKNNTEQLKRERLSTMQLSNMIRAMDQYENLVMRLLSNWPILSDRDIQARRMLIDDLNQRKLQLRNSLAELRKNASDEIRTQIDLLMETRAKPIPEQLANALATTMENAAASLVPSRIALNMSTMTLQQHLGRLASQRAMTLATETAIGSNMMGVVKDYFQKYQQYAAEFIAAVRNATNPSERVQLTNNFAEHNLNMIRTYYRYMQTYMTINPSQASIVRQNFEGIREGFRSSMRELLETVKKEIQGSQADIDALNELSRRYNESLNEMQL
jgi:hypothetical protein